MPDTRNLKKRGRIWWFVKQKGGETIEESLHTEDIGVAQTRRNRLLEELGASEAIRWGERKKWTLNAAAEKFAAEHFPNIKPAAARRYVVSMSHLLNHFGETRLDDVKSASLVSFELKRKADGVSSSTIRRDLACLSAIFSTAEYWEWVTYNPVKPFLRGRAGLREGDPHERFLTHEEEAAILDVIAFKAGQAVTFAIDTGLRKEEQFSILWTDIDLRAKELTVRKEVSKSSRSRTVPLLERTWRMLREMPRHLHCPYVFYTQDGERYSPGSPTNWEALQKAVRKAGITNRVQWHDLRRTCGCRLLQDRGFSMEAVAKWLGHSSVKVTERHYAFLTKAELHRAVERSERAMAEAV